MKTGLGALLILTFAVPLAAADQPATTLGELATHLKAGEEIVVALDTQQELRGRFVSASAQDLVLERDKQPVTVPLGNIARVQRPPDRLWNGALIGLGIGTGVGVALAAGDKCAPGEIACVQAAGVSVLVGAGLGTALGLTLDALIHRDRPVYVRARAAFIQVGPMVQRHGAGARATLTF